MIVFLYSLNRYVATFKKLSLLVPIALLSACEMTPVAPERDGGPEQPLDVSHIPEPVPRQEPRTMAGNITPYTVMGKTYHLLKSPDNYRERGIASWYGTKFHGKKTSNGELYDMFGMTAAHKTLPIPSYVRVTNLGNQLSVIVRVNDRGPFHDGRIIDLTYTAARKLGFDSMGTADVIVEYIDPDAYQPAANSIHVDDAQSAFSRAPAPENSAGYALPDNTYLQIGAYSRESAAQSVKEKVTGMTRANVFIRRAKKDGVDVFRVQAGPFADNLQLMTFRQKLIDEKYPSPYVVYQ